jgi:hypothetical protein
MALSACSPFKFHCTDGHSDTVGVAMDQQPDLFGSFNVLLPMVTLTLLAIVLFCSMSRPSAVDRIAGLFFQSSVGLFPYLSIASIVAPVSTGCINCNCC